MMSYVSCRRIRIGDDARIREQVSVAGPELPESSFELGSRTVILQRTSINPTKPVTIGDDSGIGGHCLIFTHGAWLNALHGYPVTYKSVTIGRSVWLPWRVFVMPGAEIGDGSVIGANSLVNGTIPPMSLAAGSPAKVLRTAPDFPRAMTDERRRRIVDDILGEFERMVADHGIDVVHEGPDRTFRRDGSNFRLRRVLSEDRPGGIENGDTVLSEVALTEQEKQSYRRSGAYWLDVDAGTRSEGGSALTEELALFLGRYGIRLARE
ncbi:MAG: acyltransferase [Gemmatimonadetes bacterium]|nr:acyltransferase [Gemmatimonadota bacterium]